VPPSLRGGKKKKKRKERRNPEIQRARCDKRTPWHQRTRRFFFCFFSPFAVIVSPLFSQSAPASSEIHDGQIFTYPRRYLPTRPRLCIYIEYIHGCRESARSVRASVLRAAGGPDSGCQTRSIGWGGGGARGGSDHRRSVWAGESEASRWIARKPTRCRYIHCTIYV